MPPVLPVLSPPVGVEKPFETGCGLVDPAGAHVALLQGIDAL